MHGPAVYVIAAFLFILAGLLLFAAASSWAKIARKRLDVPSDQLRAAAGLTAAALVLLGAATLWTITAFFLQNARM